MFIIVSVLVLCFCVLSVFTVYRILELEKEINSLYDNYSNLLEKSFKLNISKGE